MIKSFTKLHTFTCDKKLDLKLHQNLREQNLTPQKKLHHVEKILNFFQKLCYDKKNFLKK